MLYQKLNFLMRLFCSGYATFFTPLPLLTAFLIVPDNKKSTSGRYLDHAPFSRKAYAIIRLRLFGGYLGPRHRPSRF